MEAGVCRMLYFQFASLPVSVVRENYDSAKLVRYHRRMPLGIVSMATMSGAI